MLLNSINGLRVCVSYSSDEEHIRGLRRPQSQKTDYVYPQFHSSPIPANENSEFYTALLSGRFHICPYNGKCATN